MTRAELLQRHVESIEGEPVAWGENDCTAWARSWIEAAIGKVVPQLGDYASMEEAHALIDAHGGLDVLWVRALALAGIHSTPYEPVLGDVGIVQTFRFGQVGVIFAENGVALWRADKGTALLRPRRRDIIKVWALPQ